MKRSRLLIIALALIGLYLSSSISVFACSGDFPPEAPLETRVDGANLIFVGTVTGDDGAEPYTRVYTVHVDSYLKGHGPSEVLISGYGNGIGDCLDSVEVDQHKIFLVDGDPATKDVLYASYQVIFDSLMEVTDENATAISDIVGHAPTAPYSTPVWTLIKTWTYSSVFKILVLLGIPFIVVAGAFAVLRARHRPTKKKNDAKA